MKKNLPVIVFLVVLMSIVTYISVKNYTEKQAKSTATAYYEALINENYEEAVGFLAIRDQYIDEITTETKPDDAKKLFLKKTQVLKEMNYKIISINNISVRKEDSVILINANLTKEVNGEKSSFIETLQLAGDKVWIDYSGDEFAKFRDGFVKKW